MASVEKSRGATEEEEEGSRRRVSGAGSDGSGGSFSDSEEGSWHSPFGSNGGRSYDEHNNNNNNNNNRFSSVSDLEIGGASEPHRRSSSSSTTSDCAVEVDLESGVPEIKVHMAKVEKDCRICHLTLETSSQGSSGIPIELGCSCKDDLAAAHKHCAEAWFKIRGNKTCEICGSVARNVAGASEAEVVVEQWNETSSATANTAPAPTLSTETRSFWQGHRFLNFLLACMVFAFVISWLFHFNVPS